MKRLLLVLILSLSSMYANAQAALLVLHFGDQLATDVQHIHE